MSLALAVPSSLPNLPILAGAISGYYEQEGIRVTACGALEAALHAVRNERRCAVLDVWLPKL